MAKDIQQIKPWSLDIDKFRTMNARDSVSTVKDDELPLCINFQPIGTSLYTVKGLGATLNDGFFNVGSSLGLYDIQEWLSGSYTAGDSVIPVMNDPAKWKHMVYVAQNSATSGGAEPTWPSVSGDTVVDGGITWKAFSLAVKRMISFNWAGVPYIFIATESGSLHKVDVSTTAFTQYYVAPPGTVVDPYFAPWKNTRVLIVDLTKGYSTYDGTTLAAFNSTYKGDAIAVFATRVWIASGRTIYYTAPDNSDATGFAATGSGLVVDNYGSLSVKVVKLIATQEYLYVIGDHAVHLIHGVVLLDTGATVFQINDAIPGVGTYYPDTAIAYRGYVYLFGQVGAYVVQGQNDEIISSYFDKLFLKIDFTFKPVAFLAMINNKLSYCVIVYMTDPVDGNLRKFIWVVYEERWFLVQLDEAYNITTAVVVEQADNLIAWISYGDRVAQAFKDYVPMKRKLRTKSMHIGHPLYDKIITRIGAQIESLTGLATDLNVQFTVITDKKSIANAAFIPQANEWFNELGQILVWQNALSQSVAWAYPENEIFAKTKIEGRGKRFQVDYEETSSEAYVLTQIQLEGVIGADW